MATAKLRLDTRPKSNGLHNVKITVYHKAEKKFFATKIDLSKADFHQISESLKGNVNLRRDDKIRVKEILREKLDEAQKICENLGNRFSYFKFNELYTDSKGKSDSLEFLFDQFISGKKGKGKIGTAISYTNAQHSILSFSPKATITDITISFLERYKSFMESEGKSRTTVGIYMRSLRTIFNKAINSGLVDKSDYPFGKGKFGINFKDIIYLRKSNLSKDQIVFKREKVKEKDPTFIYVEITEELNKLIKRNRTHKIGKDPLLFDVISEDRSLEDQYKQLRQFIKTTNKYLKRVGEKLELSIPVSTYTARHSWATVAQRQGISVGEISEALGHASIKTTSAYLNGFAKEQRRRNAQKTADFKSLVNG